MAGFNLSAKQSMELGLCEQLIKNTYEKNPASLENISQLTSSARGKDKLSCMQAM